MPECLKSAFRRTDLNKEDIHLYHPVELQVNMDDCASNPPDLQVCICWRSEQPLMHSDNSSECPFLLEERGSLRQDKMPSYVEKTRRCYTEYGYTQGGPLLPLEA